MDMYRSKLIPHTEVKQDDVEELKITKKHFLNMTFHFKSKLNSINIIFVEGYENLSIEILKYFSKCM